MSGDMLLLPARVQPTGPFRINRNNPLSKGLVFASAAGLGHISDGYTFKRNSGYADKNGVYGYPRSEPGRQAALFNPLTLTIVAGIYVPTQPGTWSTLLGFGYWVSSANNYDIGLTTTGTGGYIGLIARYNSPSISGGSSEWPVTYPYKKHLRISCSAWTTISLYEDAGVSPTHTETPTGGVPSADSRRIFHPDGLCNYAFIFNRVLTAAEDAEIKRDPWQLIEPVSIPINYRTPAKRKTQDIVVPWDSQPPLGTPVNWSSDLAQKRGLAFVFHGGGSIEFWGGRTLTYPQGMVEAGRSGFGIKTIGTGPAFANTYKQPLDEMTMMFAGDCKTLFNNTTTTTFIKIGNSCNLQSEPFQGGAKIELYAYRYPDYNGQEQTSANAFVEGRQVIVVATFKRNGRTKLYVNGIKLSDIAAGTFQVNPAAQESASVSFAGGEQRSATVTLSAFWTRELSEEQVYSLSNNPWQLFEPRRISFNAGTPITTRRETEHFSLPHDRQPSGPNIEMADNAIIRPVFLYIPTVQANLANNAPTFSSEYMNLMATVKGLALNSGTAYSSWPLPLWSPGAFLKGSRPVTVLAYVYMKHATQSDISGGAVYVQTSASEQLSLALNLNSSYVGSAGDILFAVYSSTGSNRRYFSIPLSQGYHAIGLSWDFNSSSIIWSVDGRTVANVSTNHAGNIPSTYLDNTSTGVNPAMGCQVYLSASAHTLLNQDALNALTADPWQVIKPTQIPYDQSALVRQLDPLTPTDGYTPRILLEQ